MASTKVTILPILELVEYPRGGMGACLPGRVAQHVKWVIILVHLKNGWVEFFTKYLFSFINWGVTYDYKTFILSIVYMFVSKVNYEALCKSMLWTTFDFF